MVMSRRTMRFFCLCLIISLFCCAEDNTQRDMSESPYDWTWGEDGTHLLGFFMGKHLDFISYGLGCSLLSEIDATADEVVFSCGYRIDELPTLRVKHYDREDGTVDDGSLDDFSFTGVVLLVFATQQHIDFDTPEPGEGFRLFISDMMRVAKTADKTSSLEEVYFENVSLAVGNPESPDYIEICWRQLEPQFMICWDNVKTGRRAYQLISPRLQHRSDIPESECETFIHPGFHHEFYGYGSEFVKGLGVYWPLLEQYIHKPSPLDETLGIKSLIEFIDEVLPRPRGFLKSWQNKA